VSTDNAEAFKFGEQSLALYRELQDEEGIALVLFLIGSHAMFTGDFAHAKAPLAEVLSIQQQRSNPEGVALALTHLGALAGYQGDHTTARAHLREGLAIQRRAGSAFGTAYALSTLAMDLLESDEPVEACVLLRESIELNWKISSHPQLAWCFGFLAKAATGLGRYELAAFLRGAEAAMRIRTGALVPPAELETNDRSVSIVKSKLAADVFETAWAEGSAATPRAAVERALAIAAELGSLQSTSVAATADPFGLTPRESEILRLLVEGKTNPEIAEALFVSPRTVGTHLTNVFAKLGVANRAEAVAIAVRQGLA
jgi:DNA-binding CsgD family transcriptional regulator